MIKVLALLLSLFPTFKFITIISGSTPLGVFMYPFLVLKVRNSLIIGLLIMISIALILSMDYFNPLEFIKLLLGPLIMILFAAMNTDFLQNRRLVNLIELTILLLLVDSVIAGNFEGTRGNTFLTHEPSHTARVFGVLLLIGSLFTKMNKLRLFIWATLFLLFNKSGTFFLFYIYYFIFCLQIKIIIKSLSILSLILLIIWTSDLIQHVRFYILFMNIFTLDGNLMLQQDFMKLSYVLGGPRLTFLVSALLNSGILGYGIGAADLIIADLLSTAVHSPYVIPYIAQNEVASTGSYIGQIAFELGIPFALLLIILLFTQVKKKNFSLGFFGMFSLIFLSTTTLPTPWILLGLSMNLSLNSNNNIRKLK